jgi:hypothetical protein
LTDSAHDSQDWAIDYALTSLAAVRTISWADASSCLLADCASVVECDSDRSEYLSASSLAHLGALYFRALPAGQDGSTEISWWRSVGSRVDQIGEHKQTLVAGPAGEMAGRLSGIKDTYGRRCSRSPDPRRHLSPPSDNGRLVAFRVTAPSEAPQAEDAPGSTG